MKNTVIDTLIITPLNQDEIRRRELQATIRSQLTGFEKKYGYRLRVGRFRVFFDVADIVRIISIKEVKKRDDRTY